MSLRTILRTISWQMRQYTWIMLLLLVSYIAPAKAQNVAVKTNALYWATASLNAAAEAKVADKWTVDLSVGYNPFTFSDNKKLKHIAVQPEARYWLCRVFSGHFVGAHILYSHYNAGGINLPVFPELKDNRFQGDLGAIGIAYGYSWMLPSKRWSIEAEIGLGYGITKYSKYECATCGSKLAEETRSLFLPTKLALTVVYYIK